MLAFSAEAGGAWLVPEAELTPTELARRLSHLLGESRRARDLPQVRPARRAGSTRPSGLPTWSRALQTIGVRFRPWPLNCPRRRLGDPSDETAARHWSDPLRRDRRHRHERHRRGSRQPELSRARLRRRRQLQRSALARPRDRGRDRPRCEEPRRCGGRGRLLGDQARQSRVGRGAGARHCRSSAVRKCWPS